MKYSKLLLSSLSLMLLCITTTLVGQTCITPGVFSPYVEDFESETSQTWGCNLTHSMNSNGWFNYTAVPATVVGKQIRNTSTGAYFPNNRYGIVFDVTQTLDIHGVYVYPNATGTIEVRLFDSNDTFIGQARAFNNQDVATKVFVPFSENVRLTPGTNYHMDLFGSDLGIEFYKQHEYDTDFPYDAAPGISLTGNSYTGNTPHSFNFTSTADYYFLYDIQTTLIGEAQSDWYANVGGFGSIPLDQKDASPGTTSGHFMVAGCQDISILESPCFDLSNLSNPTLSFSYVAHYSSAGQQSAVLDVEVYQGGKWLLLHRIFPDLTNASGYDEWKQVNNLNLAGYPTEKIRFVKKSGQTYLIDNIIIGDEPVNYCTPNNLPTSSGHFINGVSVGTINNSNTGSTSGPSYVQYNDTTNLTYKSLNHLQITSGNAIGTRYAAFLDINRDGDFDDDGEELGELPPTTSAFQTQDLPFTVFYTPGFVQGLAKLRIRGVNSTSPTSTIFSCSNLGLTDGETEDYFVNLEIGCDIANPTLEGDVRCRAGIVHLKATPGVSNANCRWYTNSIQAGTPIFEGLNYSPNLSSSTTYYVTTFDSLCESKWTIKSVTGTILDQDGPSIDISSDTAICAGDTLTLFSSGGLRYNWSNGDTTSTIKVAPSNTTSFVLSVADSANCKDSASVFVGVKTLPQINMPSDTTLCQNDCHVLTSTALQYDTATSNFSFDNSASSSIVDFVTVSKIITVSGLSSNSILSSICLDLDHSYISDVTLYLFAPDGTALELSSGNGGSTDNFKGCFTIDATANLDTANGPFSDNYIPEGGNLHRFFQGDLNGDWILTIRDLYSGDNGTFNQVTLDFIEYTTTTSSLSSGVWSPNLNMTNSTTFSPGICPQVTTDYNLQVTDAYGCSNAADVHVTVLPTSNIIDTVEACNSHTWIDGNNYTSDNNTATHTLINSMGCDSVITLNLTMNSNSGTDVISSCDSYTWIDGNNYSASNNSATFTLMNSKGCDSVVQLNLTIGSPNSSTDLITACQSYTWINGITYTANIDTATFTFANSTGCDSVVTLNLTIDTLEPSISSFEATLTCNNTNASYQWLNCDDNYAMVSGETDATFTPSVGGNYAVEITTNNCTDTSDCINVTPLGIYKNQLGINPTLYPNPVHENGDFSIDFGEVVERVSISITGIDGKLIKYDTYFNQQLVHQQIEVPSGIYFISIQTGEFKRIFKMIKE